ncbi:MAG: carbonic anhydrase [Planctomycetia bacterium]|nr:carbonic anhydrase [Planctomycetia bacterium]
MQTKVKSSASSSSPTSITTRRRWFGMSLGAIAAGVWCSTTANRVTASAAEATRNPESPDEALAILREGNQRFVAGKSLSIHRDLERVKEVAPKQTPFAAFLGCADSRVPIEIVFDQGFGDLFVTRIAGNVATSENIGSLEFGTLVLGAKVLYVLGHTNCGAVSATVQGTEVPGQISGLFQHIRPAVRAAKGNLAKSVEENVRLQASVLSESSPVLARLIREKKLIVTGGVYDLQTGIVSRVELD